MATAPKGFGTGGSGHAGHGDTQLRRDRVVGMVALIVVAALMLLMIWLASLSGTAPVDTFPMMP
jgi:hypothetical protein